MKAFGLMILLLNADISYPTSIMLVEIIHKYVDELKIAITNGIASIKNGFRNAAIIKTQST